MPTYDYECQACGHHYEVFQSMTAQPIKKCPRCKKAKAQRMIGTGAAILFKGKGFYQTDYRSDAYRQAAEKDKPAAAPAESSAAGKTPGVASAESPAAAKTPATAPAAPARPAKPSSARTKA